MKVNTSGVLISEVDEWHSKNPLSGQTLDAINPLNFLVGLIRLRQSFVLQLIIDFLPPIILPLPILFL